MDQTGWIILGICIAIFGLIVILFLMNLIFFFIFKNKLKNKRASISIILNQKYEAINNLITLLTKLNVSIPLKIIEDLKQVDVDNFILPGSDSFKHEVDSLSILKMSLVSLGEKNDLVKIHSEYILLNNVFNTLEKQQRIAFASYNSSVIGYNYWISFAFFGFIFRLAGQNKKDKIS